MARKYYSIITLIMFLSAIGCSSEIEKSDSNNASEQIIDDSKLFVPGVIRVKFKDNHIVEQFEQLNTRGFITRTGDVSIDAILSDYGVKSITPVFRISKKFEARQKRAGLHLWYEIELDETTKTKSAASELSLTNLVTIAEPALQKHLLGNPVAERDIHAISKTVNCNFNDPHLGKQWHYDYPITDGYTAALPEANISLFRAWKETTGRADVIVAVNDSGVDYNHEDLKDNMWVNTGEIANTGNDDDGNGYIDDIHGYNFLGNSPQIVVADHGTHVAGTIAATNNNGKGVCGIAGGDGTGNGVRIMACQILGGGVIVDIGKGVEQALVYAADNGAVISQNSWGYNVANYTEKIVEDAINYFIEHAGCDENGNQVGPMKGGVVFFASGNESSEQYFYPAAYSQVVAVTATSHRNKLPSYANIGRYVDIAAPGGDGTRNYNVYSTVTNNGYGYMNGTSMATPHVSGVAALMVSKYGKIGYTCDMLIEQLLASKDPIEQWEPKKWYLMGEGIVNASKALGVEDLNAPDPVNNLELVVNTNGGVQLTWDAAKDQEDEHASTYFIYMDTQELQGTKLPEKPIREVKANSGQLSFKVLFEELDMSQPMWFGIVCTDLSGNRSALSNVVNYSLLGDFEVVLSTYKVQKNVDVNWGKGFIGQLTISISDKSGKMVFKGSYDAKQSSAQLDLSFLAVGNYSIIISDGNNSAKKNITKL